MAPVATQSALDTHDGLDPNGGKKMDPMRPLVPTIGILGGRRARARKHRYPTLRRWRALYEPVWSGTVRKRGPNSNQRRAPNSSRF